MASFKIEDVPSFKEKICKLHDDAKECLHTLILKLIKHFIDNPDTPPLFSAGLGSPPTSLNIEPIEKLILLGKTYTNVPYVYPFGFVPFCFSEEITQINNLKNLIECINFSDSKCIELSSQDLNIVVSLENFVKQRTEK